MPSLEHEVLVELLRSSPSLLLELLGVAAPEVTRLSEVSAELNQLVPTEYRADGVWLVDGPDPHVAILEVQLSPDPAKPWVWPLYMSAARARHRRPAVLLVLTLDPAVARWASRPLELAPGVLWSPLVIGPEQIPWVVDPEQVRRCPEQAVLSVLAHGASAKAPELARAVLTGFTALDEARRRLYSEVVWRLLGPAIRARLEVDMLIEPHETRADLIASLERRPFWQALQRRLQEAQEAGLSKEDAATAVWAELCVKQKLREEGERALLQRLLRRRFGALPPWAEERLSQALWDDLERWADAVLTAATLEEVLGA